jgi:hypothetical protein
MNKQDKTKRATATARGTTNSDSNQGDTRGTGITPWNYNPPTDSLALPASGAGPQDVYTLCDHMEPDFDPEPMPDEADSAIGVPMTDELAAALRRQGMEFYQSQPQLLKYMDNLKPKLAALAHEALLGMGHGIIRRLAREGKRIRQVTLQNLQTAERFANEVVFTKPVICVCNFHNRRELRRTWERMERLALLTPTGWNMLLLFRYYCILLEVLEHAALPTVSS